MELKTKFDQCRYEFFKECYERELERRSQGLDRLSSAISSLTLVGGLVAYFASTLPATLDPFVWPWFWVPALLGVLCFLFGVFALMLTVFRGATFDVLNHPKRFDEAFAKARAQHPATAATDIALVHGFGLALAEQFRDLATKNQTVNDRREKRYNTIHRWTVLAGFLLILSSPSYFLLQRRAEQEPTLVTITNPPKLMEEETNPSQQPSSQPPATEPVEIKFELPPPIQVNEARELPAQLPEPSGEEGD